jgi:hypothetical protein
MLKFKQKSFTVKKQLNLKKVIKRILKLRYEN